MDACPNCPNRIAAMLAEAMGAEAEADKIRKLGCPWWWYVVPPDPAAGAQPVWRCGAEDLPMHLNRLGGYVLYSAKTVQEDRNEQRAALELVDRAVAERGGSEVLRALGRLGLGAAIGTKAARRIEGQTEGALPAESAPETVADGPEQLLQRGHRDPDAIRQEPRTGDRALGGDLRSDGEPEAPHLRGDTTALDVQSPGFVRDLDRDDHPRAGLGHGPGHHHPGVVERTTGEGGHGKGEQGENGDGEQSTGIVAHGHVSQRSPVPRRCPCGC